MQSLSVRRKFSAIPAEMQAALARARASAGLEARATPPEIEDGGIAVERYVDNPRRKGYALANQRFEIVRTSIL